MRCEDEEEDEDEEEGREGGERKTLTCRIERAK